METDKKILKRHYKTAVLKKHCKTMLFSNPAREHGWCEQGFFITNRVHGPSLYFMQIILFLGTRR